MVLAAVEPNPASTRAVEPVFDESVLESDDAFNRLAEKTAPVVYRFLIRMVGSREDAEDLTQDVFLAAYQSRCKLRVGAPALPYLLTIARRKAISLYRWRTIRSLLRPIDDREDQSAVDPALSPREQTESSRQQKRIESAVMKLNPKERAVIVLRLFEERPYEEIARIMRKPIGTIKSTVFRAERKLRTYLAEAGARQS